MSLKAFHLVFILASIALSVWFGVWCFGEYSFTESYLTLGMGIVSFASTLGLSVYLAWFLRKSRGIGYIALALALSSSQALACPVCIGDPNSLFVKSASSAVLFLLVVVAVVLVAFAGIFFVWARRDRRQQEQLSLRA